MRDNRGTEVNSTVPQYNGSPVSDKPIAGGKRKGRHMKRRPRTFQHPKVTLDNLKTARDNGGYLDGNRNCVVYYRKDS